MKSNAYTIDLESDGSDFVMKGAPTNSVSARAVFPPDTHRYIQAAAFVGSRVTCNPPPLNTDCDILVYTRHKRFLTLLEGHGWEYCSADEGYGNAVENWHERDKKVGFTSLRFEDYNVIIVYSEEHYGKFMLATELAKRLNLLKKSDRVTLFHAIRHGEVP